MNNRKIGILLSYVNIILQAVVGFLYVPILLYYIGASEYGLYQLIGSLIAYFSVMDFGLTATVTRFYSRYKALLEYKNMENILAIALIAYFLIAVVALGLGCILYFFIDQIFSNSMTINEINKAKELYFLLLINIVITLLGMLFKAIINSYEKFLFLKGLDTIQFLIQPLLVILILIKYPSAYSVALVQTFINLTLSIIRAYYCFSKLEIKIKFHYWNQDLYIEFRRLAFSVFFVALIDQIFWKTNQIILGVSKGTFDVAVYSLASLVYMNYMALSIAISGVYLPYVTELVAKSASKDDLSQLFIQIGRWQYYVLALVTSGFLIFGKQFIIMWAGQEFSDAYIITLLIIVPFTIDLIQNIGNSILQAYNLYTIRAKVLLVVGSLNLLLAILLGNIWGAIGCALATAISMFIGYGILMNWFYYKEIKLDIKRFWCEISQISLPIFCATIVGIALDSFLDSSSKLIFIIEIIIYSAFYFMMIFYFAMNQEEKVAVYKIKNKIFRFLNKYQNKNSSV